MGVTPAIVLQQLHYRSARTGDEWVGRTIGEWRRDFPFWNESTIKRAFTMLRRLGLVEIRRDGGTDRTNHYRIQYEALQALEPSAQIEPMERGESSADRDSGAGQVAPMSKGEERKGAETENVHPLTPSRRRRDLARFDEAMRR